MAFDKSVFAQLGAPSLTLTLTQGEFSVDLKVCYDMKALALIKQKLGISMFDRKELASVDPSSWPVILWAGLQKYQGNVSVDEVAMIMNPGNYQLVVEKCIEAFTMTLPKDVTDPKTETVTEPVPAQA